MSNVTTMFTVTYLVGYASGQQDMFAVREAQVGELLAHVRAVKLGADPLQAFIPPANPHVLIDYGRVEYMRVAEFGVAPKADDQ